MIIYRANMFGLSQLHQLRGRVGRNEVQSYCYLICNQDIERLKVLCKKGCFLLQLLHKCKLQSLQ